MSELSTGMQLIFVVVVSLLIIGIPCAIVILKSEAIGKFMYRHYMKKHPNHH